MDFSNLKLCSFNCCSLRKNIELIRELALCDYDFIFLQETFITDEKLDLLEFIDENYECIGVGATFSDNVLRSMAGRPEGGLAILWKKNSVFNINKITIERNLMFINVDILGINILLVNVYIKSISWEASSLLIYLESLSVLQDYIDNNAFDSVYLVGDFNADPFSGKAWQHLSNFMNGNLFLCHDKEMLGNDTCTFVGYSNSIPKWLDHIIGTKNTNNISIANVQVLHNVSGSDHLPMEVKITVQGSSDFIPPPLNLVTDNENNCVVNWNKLNSFDLNNINEMVDERLSNLEKLNVHLCQKIGCNDQAHLDQISNLYKTIVNSVSTASEYYRGRHIRRNKLKIIPGWNRNVKQLHNAARVAFVNWVKRGKVRGTREHDLMIESRKLFKKALKECQVNENKEICQTIMEKFNQRNKMEFWKEVKRKKNRKSTRNVVDGISDESQIVKLFADKFLNTETHAEISVPEKDLVKEIKNIWPEKRKCNFKISCETLKKIITRMNSGVGHDGVHSVFLKNASHSFIFNLSLFYNACYVHCYLPPELLIGTITPIPKNKSCMGVSDYRPVMQSSCLLKIFEMHVLDFLNEKIPLNFRQFGFRKGSSTTDACLILKDVVKKYTKHKTSAFATFIDLSKAFDNIDHILLGKKLLNTNVPINITVIILRYLRNQQANIKWKNSFSNRFYIDKGVRQGGILSPFLFNFYINEIVETISSMEEGCQYGYVRCNILAYADDLVLLSKTADEMNILYTKLCELIENHELSMNKDKSKCMVFNMHKQVENETLQLNNNNLQVIDNYKYLGHYINYDLSDTKDVHFRLNTFYSSFNSISRDFNFVDFNTIFFLFNSYCCPDYGISLWNDPKTLHSTIFKSFNTAYSGAMKKMKNVPLYASSHITANECQQLLLNHKVALIQARAYKRAKKECNPFFNCIKEWMKDGFFMKSIKTLFKEKYEVDIDMEDLDILTARIWWVQKHEDRRGPCYFYGF